MITIKLSSADAYLVDVAIEKLENIYQTVLDTTAWLGVPNKRKHLLRRRYQRRLARLHAIRALLEGKP